MSGKVYFADFRATPKENIPTKIKRLLEAVNINEKINKRALVAIKLHFGEMGNTAFIRPVYVRSIVGSIKEKGGIPFLVDANTLYAGTRSDAPHHLCTAIRNGFAYAVVDAPIIIADGLRGHSEIAVTVNQKHFKKVYIGSEIAEADSLVSVAHFKGHELAGFGGTIKNLGMGCASRRGKLAQHSTVGPKVVQKRCEGCGECVEHCSQKAISLNGEKAEIDPKKCIGCGECIIICPNGAIQVEWNEAVPVFMEKMVEYAKGVLDGKEGRCCFMNFITQVSPACDCYGHNDAPIVCDIGIVASDDPVAIDQASVDLVNQEESLRNCCISPRRGPGEDKFMAVYPKIDWSIQLKYGEEIG
nr:DUF362 domain-containing protein [Desulfobacterales bacterium]